MHRTDKPLLADGIYTISSKMNYKKVLSPNYRHVALFNYLGQKGEEWRFKYDQKKKAYKIYTNTSSNAGMVYQSKTSLVNIDNIDTDSQGERAYWTVEYDNYIGGYLIRNLYAPDQVLELEDAATANGTLLVTYKPYFLENQLWNIAPVQPKGE